MLEGAAAKWRRALCQSVHFTSRGVRREELVVHVGSAVRATAFAEEGMREGTLGDLFPEALGACGEVGLEGRDVMDIVGAGELEDRPGGGIRNVILEPDVEGPVDLGRWSRMDHGRRRDGGLAVSSSLFDVGLSSSIREMMIDEVVIVIIFEKVGRRRERP